MEFLFYLIINFYLSAEWNKTQLFYSEYCVLIIIFVSDANENVEDVNNLTDAHEIDTAKWTILQPHTFQSDSIPTESKSEKIEICKKSKNGF